MGTQDLAGRWWLQWEWEGSPTGGKAGRRDREEHLQH